MNNRPPFIVIIGAIVVIALIAGLIWLGLQRNNPQYGTSYTDPISGETFTAFSESAEAHEHEHGEGEDVPEPNQITITGLDNFVAGIGQEHAAYIIEQVSAFIRARAGTKSAIAGALDSKLTKKSDNPAVYTFTLVLLNPAARYETTVTIPNTSTVMPDVTFGEVAP